MDELDLSCLDNRIQTWIIRITILDQLGSRDEDLDFFSPLSIKGIWMDP